VQPTPEVCVHACLCPPGRRALAHGCNLITGDSDAKTSRLHLHFIWGEHDPGPFRAHSKSTEEPANPGREMNLHPLATAQRFFARRPPGSLSPRLKDAPAIRVQAGRTTPTTSA